MKGRARLLTIVVSRGKQVTRRRAIASPVRSVAVSMNAATFAASRASLVRTIQPRAPTSASQTVSGVSGAKWFVVDLHERSGVS
jgi:hypothetical protein